MKIFEWLSFIPKEKITFLKKNNVSKTEVFPGTNPADLRFFLMQ